ncbi:hypothetical protein FT643_17505 [Ketobacter sp. MCCC 1A13808]|uniref:hypothetical protein n=1 Tax=Ketobacter sp. MCCC 1A13808 TaxID=2602738 RepID=UPI0012EC0343|nr:hypothetical protein [Ketobacter sp. MCCC 1A13808]MVF13939.1 hypothetical protein [Ketobacter sp. MCCC 1A13808]
MKIKQVFAVIIVALAYANAYPAIQEDRKSKDNIDLSSTLSSNKEWLRSGWGVRVVIPSASTKNVQDFDVKLLTDQLSSLKTASWVMLNITEGAMGSFFTSPNKHLKSISELMVPERDLFGEAVELLRDRGFRILVYFAAQGPGSKRDENIRPKSDMHRLKVNKIDAIRVSWQALLLKEDLSHDQAVALYAIEPYAMRYANKIDGWWFDHGNWANPYLFHEAIEKGNSAALFAWNDSDNRSSRVAGFQGKRALFGWKLGRSNQYESYTNGHITPTRLKLPWWDGNEVIIEQIERSKYIDGLIPHIFLPIQAGWRAGDAGFPQKQLIDWTERVITSGGGITLAVALRKPEFKYSELESKQYDQLKQLDSYLIKKYPDLIRSNRKMN